MTKKEAEPLIQSLCHTWQAEAGLPLPPSDHHYSFSLFKSWLEAKGYGYVLDFRSTGGSDYAAEMWFDVEMRQSWRN